MWKAAKTYSTDKSALVATGAFGLFQALVKHRAHFKSSSDFDTLKSLYMKALDSQYTSVRLSAAECFALALQILTTEAILQKEATSSTSKSRTDDAEVDKPSPAPSKVKVLYSMDFTESLKIFETAYTNANSTTQLRVGLIETFSLYITSTDQSIIESRFFQIASLMLIGILSNPNIASNRHKFILARSHSVLIIKEVIASQILEEYGQTSAIKLLVNEILNNYPGVLEGQVEPSKSTLIGTIECVEGLLNLLGSSISSHADLILKTLLRLLSHPSYTVQVTACSCIRTLVFLIPSQIIPLLNNGISSINRDMAQLSLKRELGPGILGNARMISILISLTYVKPLYSSIDIASRILSMSTSLLKANGNVDVFTSAVQIEVAWLMISGLMPLGPNFVKVHLSQLLLLWKNALPKIMGKEQYSDKGTLELCYLYHVKHCTLGALVSFLANNSKLITADVAKRAIGLLFNTTAFVNAINPKQLNDDDPSHLLDKSITLQNYDYMLKRRVLQCYVYLSQYSHTLDAIPANVLPMALATFADPEKFTSLNLSTAIATNAGSIDTIWQMADNFAFGITTKIKGFDLCDVQLKQVVHKHKKQNSILEPIREVQDRHWLSETDYIGQLEQSIDTPVLEALEQDADCLLYIQEETPFMLLPTPPPTGIINYSMDIFSAVFPFQTSKIQESLLVQLTKYISSSVNTSGCSRSFSVVVNSACAIHNLLKFTMSTSSVNKEHIKNPKVLSILIKLLKSIVKNPDEYVRNVAAQSIGMVCALSGSSSTSAEVIKGLIDEIVEVRDPNARGGCAIALAYILKHVGGMLANLHLKTVLGVLVSLANDPHPTVHFWALEALSITITSVGLNFANFSSSSLSTLSKLYLLESHGDEVNSVASSNLEMRYSSEEIIARCVHALIDVLGPDLQVQNKSQDIMSTLIQQFQLSSHQRTVIQSIKSFQELIIFSPSMVDIKLFAQMLTRFLNINHSTPLRNVAVDGLYQLIRTYSGDIFEVAGKDLKLDIWLAFNATPENKVLRNSIKIWLERTSLTEPLEWISRIQAVLFKPKRMFKPQGNNDKKVAENNLADEEVEGFANSNESGDKSTNVSFDEPLKWQTRALAVELLRDLIRFNFKDQSMESITSSPLLSKIGEAIRIAFTASTSTVMELRVLGVQLLDDILVTLQDVEDPDFKEVALLEQYQAQIGSALTPAFSGDTSPELAAHAINVCATFIGIGIIKNVDRMGRILRLLTAALDSCSAKSITLGDLKTLSPNAQVMLKMAVLSSWAELQVASLKQDYLNDVVKPFINILIPLWLSALREFAQLRFEPEQSSGLSITTSSSIDNMYSALSRTSLIPFYQNSWLQFVDAIASLIEVDRQLVFDIMDEKERSVENSETGDINYSNEPAAFFFVLFGICFESLVRPQPSNIENQSDRKVQILTALKKILHPSVSGTTIYQDMVFVETIDVLDRTVLTGNIKEKQCVVDIANRLCLNHPGNIENSKSADAEDDGLSENVEQLFELVRVVMLVLTTLFPFLSDSTGHGSLLSDDPNDIELVRSSLDYLVNMVEVFPHVIRVDLYSCVLYVFGKIFSNSASPKFAKLSLIPLKRLVANMVKTWESQSESKHLIENALNTAATNFVNELKSENARERKEIRLLAIVVLFNTAAAIIDPSSSYVDELSSVLVENLAVPDFQLVTSECIQTLLIASFTTEFGKTLVVKTVPQIVSLATEDSYIVSDTSESKPNIVPKLVIDILVNLSKALTGEYLQSLLAITIPLLIWFSDEENSEIPVEQRKIYVNQKLLSLVGYDSAAFKMILQSGLSEWQREMIEYIMLANNNADKAIVDENDSSNSATHIQLKSFS